MSKVIITQDPVHFKNQSAVLSALLIVKLEESRNEELAFWSCQEKINEYTRQERRQEKVKNTQDNIQTRDKGHEKTRQG